jgi:fatty acid desaturase
VTELRSEQFPIPEKRNIAIFVLMHLSVGGLLWLASHGSLVWALLSALIFSLVNNTSFSLMHEAVHGVFSRNRFRNYLFGTLCAPTFPTSFTLQKIAHLGHHRRNRTDSDLYDYYLPDQSKAHRNFQLYVGNLMGFYWACIPISALIYLLAPWMYTSRRFIEGPAKHFGFEAHIREIAKYSGIRIWLECLLALVYQGLLWWLLDLSWQGWLLCYSAFAVHWSALQYVIHAFSVRDTVNGAWNLKVSPVTHALTLNYHNHLAHHQKPQLPWLYLPQFVDADGRRPTFWRIYFRLWAGGTRPAPAMGAPATLPPP